jgi:hypothetical protein
LARDNINSRETDIQIVPRKSQAGILDQLLDRRRRAQRKQAALRQNSCRQNELDFMEAVRAQWIE